jgi:hypothetical protein
MMKQVKIGKRGFLNLLNLIKIRKRALETLEDIRGANKVILN